jgi:ectoine hydroxylase-related dioxygenase (phytanoyl-CoA dioxygenase family)
MQFSNDEPNHFDIIARQPITPLADPHTLHPPTIPAFRSKFGGMWTDLNTAESIAAGKQAIGAISSHEASLLYKWIRDGYVILPKAVSDAAIDAALGDFDAVLDGRLERKMYYWEGGKQKFETAARVLAQKREAKLLDLHDVSYATQEIQFAFTIRRFLELVFQRPALAFQSLGFYYGSQQDIHQDATFVRTSSPLEFVASWIALEDIKPGSGELEYYPGSHTLEPYLFDGHIWATPGTPELQQYSQRLHETAKRAGLSIERFAPNKGDALIWSAGLMHGGCPITDPSLTRKSLVTHYCPADQQPMYAYKGGRLKRRSVGGNYVISESWQA